MKLKQLKIEKIKRGTPTISFNNAGCICFSKSASDSIDWLRQGQGIGFSQDLDDPRQWYMMPCNSELKLREIKSNNYTKLGFNSTFLFRKIAESFEFPMSSKFFVLRVSLTPVEYEGNIYNTLILSK